MRLVQLVLAALTVLLALGYVVADDITSVAATTNGEKMRKLLSFSDVDPSKRKSTNISIQEERGATGAAAGAGAPAGVSFPLRSKDSEGEQVTVTTYDGNGLIQRFTKWWNRHFGSDEKTPDSTRRLRQTTNNEAN